MLSHACSCLLVRAAQQTAASRAPVASARMLCSLPSYPACLPGCAGTRSEEHKHFIKADTCCNPDPVVFGESSDVSPLHMSSMSSMSSSDVSPAHV